MFAMTLQEFSRRPHPEWPSQSKLFLGPSTSVLHLICGQELCWSVEGLCDSALSVCLEGQCVGTCFTAEEAWPMQMPPPVGGLRGKAVFSGHEGDLL